MKRGHVGWKLRTAALFAVVAHTFVAGRAFAQGAGAGVIEGTVKEASSGRPLEGV